MIVIRYEGPKVGPGMPEMLTADLRHHGSRARRTCGSDDRRPILGRLARLHLIGHVTPEAQEGGPIGLIKTGDKITIDAEKNVITSTLGRRIREAQKGLESPPAESHARDALQVHQEREERERRLRDRRIVAQKR